MSSTCAKPPKTLQRNPWIGGWILVLALASAGCSKKLDERSPTAGPAKLSTGSWTPSVTGVGSSNSKGTVAVSKVDIYKTGVPMVRLNEGWSGKEISVNLGTYTAPDFGPNGSMTLMAEVLNYPTEGGAYPVLSSFSVFDGSTTTEYVNVNATCATSGMYACTGGSCVSNGCTVTSGSSAFFGRSDWDQHQIPPFGYITTNLFPRCESSENSWSACPAALSGGMKAGTYTAKYILLSDSSTSMAGQLVDLKVTKVVKQDSVARGIASATNGALNLNVILVGDENISDSHTTKGAQNLNLLFEEVSSIFKSSTGVGLGTLNVFEWSDADGGSQWSSPDYLDLGTMFLSGSAGISMLAPAVETNAINVFMVRDIQNGSSTSTILGLSGGILGPLTNGTETSGLAFSTYIGGVASSDPRIATYNPTCTLSSCPRNIQEDGFLEMAATIAHEIGHYVGLNHPTERRSLGSSYRHDQLSDTPQATARLNSSLTGYLFDQLSVYDDTTNTFNGQSCSAACDAAIGSGQKYFTAGNTNPYNPNHYCPAVEHCQFNHLMWWSTKNRRYSAGTLNGEDGNLISSQSSAILQWNPFVK